MEIAESARKHGIPDEDILHAVKRSIAPIATQDDRILFIGAARTGTFLELVILDPDTDDATVIHADILRSGYYRYLP